MRISAVSFPLGPFYMRISAVPFPFYMRISAVSFPLRPFYILFKLDRHVVSVSRHEGFVVGSSHTACRVSAMLAQIPARLLQPMHTFGTPRHRGFTCTHPASWNLQLGMRRRPTSGTFSMRGRVCIKCLSVRDADGQ